MQVNLVLEVHMDGMSDTEQLLALKQMLNDLDSPAISITVKEMVRVPDEYPY